MTGAINTTVMMSLLYLTIALVIQGSIIHANDVNSEEFTDNENISENKLELEEVKDFTAPNNAWFDMLILPAASFYPSSSAALMKQAVNSEKSLEEQIEDMKEVAQEITLALQEEMKKFFSYAEIIQPKEEEDTQTDNSSRKKRSVETPMDSTNMIMRLLKHIKSNNDYQNIAIEKMMTAQEIADKYGIEFSPDTEILSDLAVAANQHAQDMTDLLLDTIEMKNITKGYKKTEVKEDNRTNYEFPVPTETPECAQEVSHQPNRNHLTYSQTQPANHYHYPDSYPSYNYYYNYPYETQIASPPVQNYYSPPVSTRPNFYDAVSYSPDYYSYCTMEPTTMTPTVFLPIEEQYEPEPELVGEEFEETVTSKVYVDRGDEPGSATVNHVMTYTVAEKSHFRTPEIDRLPQQMQYCFFLM